MSDLLLDELPTRWHGHEIIPDFRPMVWLVNTRVQLADGSWQTVMVPQVYVRVQPGDIDGSGALMGG